MPEDIGPRARRFLAEDEIPSFSRADPERVGNFYRDTGVTMFKDGLRVSENV